MSFKNKNILIYIFVVTVYTVLYFISLKNKMVFSGDSIKYLGMAYKVLNFEIPFSGKWMPFYPILIGVLSWTGLSLFTSTIIVNYVLLVGVISILNLLFYKIYEDNSTVPLITLNVVLLTSRELYYNSMSILAELPMLFFILLILSYTILKLKNYKELEYRHIVYLSIMSLFAIFVKYNAIVIVALVLFLIVFNKKQVNKVKSLAVYLSLIFIPYLAWTTLKPEQDMLVRATKSGKSDFLNNALINVKDYGVTFIDYYSIPKFSQMAIGISGIYYVIALLLIFVALLIVFYITYKKKIINELEAVLFVFIVIYTSAMLYASSKTGINEINQRTLFYPLFISVILLLVLIFNTNVNRYIRALFAMIVIGFIGFGVLKINQTSKRFVTTGYGDLSKSYLTDEEGCLLNAVSFIRQNNINSQNVYTNKHKIIGIFFDFNSRSELPTNRQYLGNKMFYKDEGIIQAEIQNIFDKMKDNEGNIIVYVGEDYNSIYDKYYKNHLNDIEVKFFKDGFIIYKQGLN